ncbi:alpha/beta-hydrolase [Cucurbitaria berberidis CBS 394.84]|uniref:Alpha/beta-hydrolase n=1 Tax=Cucurbitaria berberidis CBS 394.84 TaxID=1168544 RepID=A0A9P4GRW7_9PLEO|nr:alpha/beta-hydrolase [Cucurbitaria berberidis CBS 394.84]KAF1850164.1 alpha/beta-hydrolase [Cucurbitaria berberidis CBS 394.84]
MTTLTYQPFKAVYALAAFGFELARFPVFLVKYLISYGRQHPEWTFRQAIAVRVFASAVYHFATVQGATALPLTPGAEKERFVSINPAKDEAYRGPLRNNTDVKPVEIGATWYPAALSAASDKSNIRVILHIHGGGFVTGDGRTRASGYMAKKLLKHSTATHILCPQYRNSTLPASKTSNPFPAALQDSLTSYLYLINDLKISPKDIILSGDSAGGNLAISLLRYIVEYGPDLGLPSPSAAFLWSPWINPADTSASFVHDNDHYATDYLCPPFTHWCTQAYAGLSGVQILDQPYISHKNRPFQTEVPLWVNTGSGEILYYDNKEWYEQMKKAGNDITLDVEKNVPHDIVLVGNILGFDKEATNCAKRAGEWVRSTRK